MQTTATTDTSVVIASVRDAATLLTAKLQSWLDVVVTKLPNFVVALLVLAIFWVIARTVRDTLKRALIRTPLTVPIVSLITQSASMGVIATGIFVGLGVLGLDKTVSSLLAGVGILGIALGFAFQDIGANFMAGIVLSIRQSFSIGDVIRSNEHTGTVRDITLQSTTVQQFTGEMVWLPNKAVISNPLVNFSTTGERRVDLEVRVSHEADMEKVRRVAIAAIEPLHARLESRPVDLYYTDFAESSINFTIRFWIDFAREPDYRGARSEAMIAIRKAFRREGISIPFPIRTLDFSPVGGVTLGEVRMGSNGGPG